MESQGLGKAFHGGEHYENFPVGSWLVPKPMRKAVLALYRFARTGDDLADEGELSVEERLSGLKALQEGLTPLDRHGASPLAMTNSHCEEPDTTRHCEEPDTTRHCEEPAGRRGNLAVDRHGASPLAMTRAIGAALRAELDAHGVPTAPALALLSAFRQDVHNPILQTEDDLLDYCSRSANPIGQLVLGFAGLADLNTDPCALVEKSNAICTGLQLANFAQDMGQDFSRGRIYVPQSWGDYSSLQAGSPRRFGARDDGTRSSLRGGEAPVAIQLVTKMARWAQEHLAKGQGLPRLIRHHPTRSSFRLALEIAVTLEGGNAICKKVLKQPAAVWEKSPSLSKKDLPVLLLRSLTRL